MWEWDGLGNKGNGTLDCLEQLYMKLFMTMASVHCQVFIVTSSHNQLYITYVQKCWGRGSTKKMVNLYS